MDVVGVDGTRGGWIAVRLAEGKFSEARFFPEFGGLLEAFPEAAVIAVDIPIGFPPSGRRLADEKAKDAVKSRRNSVFFVPPRPALEAPTFEEAVRTARSLDSSMSQQIYALRQKIFEVGRLASDMRIIEVHPEVSFWALNEGKALKHKKRSWNGMMTRLELLRKAGIELPSAANDLGSVPPDDVVDAAAAAWSAFRAGRGEARSLPEQPENGGQGRPVAIWY